MYDFISSLLLPFLNAMGCHLPHLNRVRCIESQ